jgi:uncharacterized damage-inducible protein DinB
MKLIDSLISEFEQEVNTTRRHFERLPHDKLEWRPHEKSFTAIALTSHIVESIGWGESIFTLEEIDFDPATYKPYQAASQPELVKEFEERANVCKQALAKVSDTDLDVTWRLKMGGKLLLERPRAAVFRDFVLSHMIHHRGQFTVYLRLLGIPVPGSYGPTADESNM